MRPSLLHALAFAPVVIVGCGGGDDGASPRPDAGTIVDVDASIEARPACGAFSDHATSGRLAATFATSFGESPRDGVIGPFAVGASSDGSTLVGGSFLDRYDLGTGGALTSPAGVYGGFLAKLSASGAPLWLSPAESLPARIVAGATNVWVVSSLSDFTLARFAPDGALRSTWPMHPYGLPPVAPGADGTLWLANTFVSPAFDYGTGTLPVGAGASLDVALLKVDADGAIASARSLDAAIWSTPAAGERAADVRDVAPAPDGGALVLADLTEAGVTQLALLRLGPDAGVRWTTRFPQGSNDAHPRVASDAAGNALVVATVDEVDIDLGCGALHVGSALAYVAADGQARWTRHLPGGLQLATAGFDASGGIVLAGTEFASVDLGGGALPWPEGTLERVAVARYGADGGHLGSWNFGPARSSIVAGAVSAEGEPLLAIAYEGALDLGLAAGPVPAPRSRSTLVTKLAPRD